MKKATVELQREEHIFGYGRVDNPYSQVSLATLDFILEWTRDKDVKIYKHIIRHAEENISETKFYKFRSPLCPPKDIPYCDLVTYIDIYYQ